MESGVLDNLLVQPTWRTKNYETTENSILKIIFNRS